MIGHIYSAHVVSFAEPIVDDIPTEPTTGFPYGKIKDYMLCVVLISFVFHNYIYFIISCKCTHSIAVPVCPFYIKTCTSCVLK